MTINFLVGDVVFVNIQYVTNVLSALPASPTLSQTLALLGDLQRGTATVAATGTDGNGHSFIRIIPTDFFGFELRHLCNSDVRSQLV